MLNNFLVLSYLKTMRKLKNLIFYLFWGLTFEGNNKQFIWQLLYTSKPCILYIYSLHILFVKCLQFYITRGIISLGYLFSKTQIQNLSPNKCSKMWKLSMFLFLYLFLCFSIFIYFNFTSYSKFSSKFPAFPIIYKKYFYNTVNNCYFTMYVLMYI